MYGAPPSLALFTRMEEDKKLVDEVVADQKGGRETGAGLLDSSLKIGLRVQKELGFPPCSVHRQTSVAASAG